MALVITRNIDALSPSRQKGDIVVYGDTASARFPVQADGLVLTADSLSPLGVRWAAPAGGAATTLVEIEVQLAAVPARSGRFIINGVGFTPGAPAHVLQSSGPYTGKGTRTDEAEMDGISVRAQVSNSTTIESFWSSQSPVVGNFTFAYLTS